MECKLISEHFIRSDYWHIYPTFFFYFSSVFYELNSNIVNFVAVGYTSVLTQKKVFHLFFSGDYNSRRLFSESVQETSEERKRMAGEG